MAGLFLIKGYRLIIGLALVLAGCNGLFFHPDDTHVSTPCALGLTYCDVYFGSSDGIKLHGWFLPASGEALGTVLYLHGNAQNISTHIHNVSWLPERRFNVFLMDYRGYGASEGEPDIGGIHKDVASAIDYLVETAPIDPDRLIVFGQSLGGSVAIHSVATSPYRRHIKALVIEGTFSGYQQIFREKLADFWLTWPLQWPLSLAVSDKFNPLDAIAQVTPIPVLIIHGENDPIVPVYHARQLYQAAGQPKDLWIVPGGGHIEAFVHACYRERLVAYLRQKYSDGRL